MMQLITRPFASNMWKASRILQMAGSSQRIQGLNSQYLLCSHASPRPHSADEEMYSFVEELNPLNTLWMKDMLTVQKAAPITNLADSQEKHDLNLKITGEEYVSMLPKYQDGILVWAQEHLTSNRAEEHHTQAPVQETAALLELRHNIFLECFKLHSARQLLVQEPKPTHENGEVSGIEFAEMRREMRHMKASLKHVEARLAVLENDKAVLEDEKAVVKLRDVLRVLTDQVGMVFGPQTTVKVGDFTGEPNNKVMNHWKGQKLVNFILKLDEHFKAGHFEDLLIKLDLDGSVLIEQCMNAHKWILRANNEAHMAVQGGYRGKRPSKIDLIWDVEELKKAISHLNTQEKKDLIESALSSSKKLKLAP